MWYKSQGKDYCKSSCCLVSSRVYCIRMLYTVLWDYSLAAPVTSTMWIHKFMTAVYIYGCGKENKRSNLHLFWLATLSPGLEVINPFSTDMIGWSYTRLENIAIFWTRTCKETNPSNNISDNCAIATTQTENALHRWQVNYPTISTGNIFNASILQK